MTGLGRRRWIGLLTGALLAGCTGLMNVSGSRKVAPGSAAAAGDTPTVSAKAKGGGSFLVRVWPQGIPARIKTVVAAYQLDLVANQPGDGNKNEAGVPAFNKEAGDGRNDYGAAEAIVSHTQPAGTDPLVVRFVDVAPGDYRIRINALDKDGTNVSWPLGPVGKPPNDQANVSMNAVTVVSATINIFRNTYPNGGSETNLDCPIQALTTDKE
jgi:hypothetical protein